MRNMRVWFNRRRGKMRRRGKNAYLRYWQIEFVQHFGIARKHAHKRSLSASGFIFVSLSSNHVRCNSCHLPTIGLMLTFWARFLDLNSGHKKRRHAHETKRQQNAFHLYVFSCRRGAAESSIIIDAHEHCVAEQWKLNRGPVALAGVRSETLNEVIN